MKISIKNHDVCGNCMNRTCAFVDVRIKEQFYSLRTETTVCPTGILETETNQTVFNKNCVHCALCSMSCHANNLEVIDDGHALDFSGLSEFQMNAIALSYLDHIVEFAANTNRNRSMSFDGFIQTRAGEACFVEVDYGNDSLECCRRLVGDFITYEGNIGPIRKGVMIMREYPREGSRDIFNVIDKLSIFPTTKDCEIYFCTFDTLLQIALNIDSTDWELSDLFYNPNGEELSAYLERVKNRRRQEEQDEIKIIDTSEVPVSERFSRYLPLYSIKAACGPHEYNFSEEGLDNDLGWIDASEFRCRLNKNMFVVQAVGHSMEPKINDGDYCVFERYAPDSAGSREGKIVLAKDITEFDDDYSGRFTIKKYHRVSGNLVELRSINVGHPTFTLKPNDECENNNTILAIFVDTL